MSDQPTDHADHVAATDQPPTDHGPMSIEEAANQLGITVNAVRQRLKRGTLIGHKTEAGWLVVLARPTTEPVADQPTTDRPTNVVGHRPTTTDHDALSVLRELLDEERAALVEERSKVERLTEAAAVWQVRAIQAEERLKQLTAGEVVRSGPGHDARPDAPAAPGGATGADVRDDASPRGRPWWRRWFGG